MVSLLLTVILDNVSRTVQDKIQQCKLFVDVIVLMNETRDDVKLIFGVICGCPKSTRSQVERTKADYFKSKLTSVFLTLKLKQVAQLCRRTKKSQTS